MQRFLLAILAGTVLTFVGSTPAGAQETQNECYTGWYQGAPIEVCPPTIPDPTNCYTGWYQGAPQEVCMPTGWTFNGQPLVIHVSKDYVAPVTVVEVAVAAPVERSGIAAANIPSVPKAPETVRQAEPRG
jgi:hypothetical protein